MDGSRIQAKVNRGYALAAKRPGLPHRHFSPQETEAPLAKTNLLGELVASFSADDYKFRRPHGYGKATWTGLWDGARAVVGDNLVWAADGAALFVAAQDPLLPMVAVRCNAAPWLPRLRRLRPLWRPRPREAPSRQRRPSVPRQSPRSGSSSSSAGRPTRRATHRPGSGGNLAPRPFLIPEARGALARVGACYFDSGVLVVGWDPDGGGEAVSYTHLTLPTKRIV